MTFTVTVPVTVDSNRQSVARASNPAAAHRDSLQQVSRPGPNGGQYRGRYRDRYRASDTQAIGLGRADYRYWFEVV